LQFIKQDGSEKSYAFAGIEKSALEKEGFVVLTRNDGSLIDKTKNKANDKKLHAFIDSINNPPKASKPSNSSSSNQRIVIAEGSKKIGDVVGGKKITGFGRAWRANADTASVHGLHPSVEWVQYAYFE
jgi:hypothetical protein